ncbi:MAG: acyltransferase [Hyphomonadaceae bacterium]|nr:acyltransferase [Hyphomonadaceae bacterium]
MISPRAQVDTDVRLGDGTRVWQFASVIRGAIIGKNCSVASCAIVDGAILGDGCIVAHGASVHPGAKIGNRVFIGPGAVLCNDRWPKAHKYGFDIDKLLGGFVGILIEDEASIGANAVILPGVVIGASAMIAAGAVVTGNVPARSLWRRDGLIKLNEAVRAHDRMREAQC